MDPENCIYKSQITINLIHTLADLNFGSDELTKNSQNILTKLKQYMPKFKQDSQLYIYVHQIEET